MDAVTRCRGCSVLPCSALLPCLLWGIALDYSEHALDHFRHTRVVESQCRIACLVIVGIAVEGSVRDHERGEALSPVATMIGEIYARDEREGIDGDRGLGNVYRPGQTRAPQAV
jgi:hypothetical protein